MPFEIKIMALLTIGFLLTVIAWAGRRVCKNKRDNIYKETR